MRSILLFRTIMKILTDLSNLFCGQTTLTVILLLPKKTRVKYLLTGPKNAEMVTFSLYGINLFTFPYL